jgi:hypothetical protein
MDINPYQPPPVKETSPATSTGNSGRFTALLLGLPIIIFILSDPIWFIQVGFRILFRIIAEVLAIFSLEQA